MRPVAFFELGVVMVVAILALTWLAGRLRLPPSVALLAGGGALAFVPGMPQVHLDSDLVLALFLPPLLADGAWNTAIVHFRRHFIGILSLSVGAVLFTTLVVAAVTHWLVPALPWAACAALGAIVSPPDAVSARAVLSKVRLPRRLSTLLEGESMLNDAAGLVVFRFAVTAALGGGFSLGAATGRFALLALGGAAVGVAIAALWRVVARRLTEENLVVACTALVCWLAYIAGDSLGLSGVIATVAAGMVLGWSQHTVFTAGARIRGTSFWQVMVFVLEAAVFILIGLSLRGVLERVGGLGALWGATSLQIAAIVVAMTLARFVWVFGSDAVVRLLIRLGMKRYAPMTPAETIVLGWAGMRGVVSLAVALALPAAMPGRDFMLVTAFGVILATVVLQGMTLGLVIGWTGLRAPASDRTPLDLAAAEARAAGAQLAVVQVQAYDEAGTLIHPRLLDQYSRRAEITAAFVGNEADHIGKLVAHYDVVLAAIAAGRSELVRLYRAGQIDEEILIELERDLDLEELGAIAAKSGSAGHG